MSKFKVGDRVRANQRSNGQYTITNERNKWEGIVTEVRSSDFFVARCGDDIHFTLRDEYFDLVDTDSENKSANGCEQKIIITSDGKTTTAKLIEGKNTIKKATAKCSPDDIFDFIVGAELAFQRLVANLAKPVDKSDEVCTDLPKLHIRNGDKVRIRSWKSMAKEYGLDKDGDIKCAPFYVRDMKQYCGQVLIVSRVVDDDYFHVEGSAYNFPMCCIQYMPDEDHVKPVSRDAKCGEFVRIVTDGAYNNKYTIGDVYRVEEISESGKARLRTDDGTPLLTWRKDEYIVLEGYVKHKFKIGDRVRKTNMPNSPKGTIVEIDEYDVNIPYRVEFDNHETRWSYEHYLELIPDEPKYLNGKVVCVKSSYSWWTVGKVYEVKDGVIIADDGDKYPHSDSEPYKDFDDVRHAGCLDYDRRHNKYNEFIEFKG